MCKTHADLSIWVALLALLLSTPLATPVLLSDIMKSKAAPETGSKRVHGDLSVCLRQLSEMYTENIFKKLTHPKKREQSVCLWVKFQRMWGNRLDGPRVAESSQYRAMGFQKRRR